MHIPYRLCSFISNTWTRLDPVNYVLFVITQLLFCLPNWRLNQIGIHRIDDRSSNSIYRMLFHTFSNLETKNAVIVHSCHPANTIEAMCRWSIKTTRWSSKYGNANNDPSSCEKGTRVFTMKPCRFVLILFTKDFYRSRFFK